jgi:hypothetical protein
MFYKNFVFFIRIIHYFDIVNVIFRFWTKLFNNI